MDLLGLREELAANVNKLHDIADQPDRHKALERHNDRDEKV
jgi:hypothetical protein